MVMGSLVASLCARRDNGWANRSILNGRSHATSGGLARATSAGSACANNGTARLIASAATAVAFVAGKTKKTLRTAFSHLMIMIGLSAHGPLRQIGDG